jgi:hypothetical protein
MVNVRDFKMSDDVLGVPSKGTKHKHCPAEM